MRPNPSVTLWDNIQPMKFNHLNLVVRDPEASAEFYKKILPGNVVREWLGESLHLRTENGIDLAFQSGIPLRSEGAHHGFLAEGALAIEHLLAHLKRDGVQITDDCTEQGFRSVKFLDPDGYEIEVYWEKSWPQG